MSWIFTDVGVGRADQGESQFRQYWTTQRAITSSKHYTQNKGMLLNNSSKDMECRNLILPMNPAVIPLKHLYCIWVMWRKLTLRKSLHKTGANIQGRLDLAGIDKSVYRKWSRCTFRSSQTGSYELV